ncbi:MAG: peptidoglycan-binding protein [Alistipes sp.]|nr:peptidoglycan-binding protein [Alistipes sp.]
MAIVEKLVPFILKWEGGFVDDKHDRGGATNRGVTIGTFRHFYGQARTVDDLKKMSHAQWEKIFMAGYWLPWKASEIKSQGIANIVVDWAWASGTTTAICQVQRILGVTVDGIVGDETLTAINKREARELFDIIKRARIDFVNQIVRNNPTQARFSRGWVNRINDIPFEG